MSPDPSDAGQSAKDEATYALLHRLDELESTREELLELGVTSVEELAERVGPPARELLARLRGMGVRSLDELNERIETLHHRLDNEAEPR